MLLSKILEQIKVNQEHANAPLEREPVSTYTGRLGRQQRAKESLKDLKRDYRKALRESALFMIVAGSAKDEFASIVTNDTFKLFAADPTDLYKDLANRVNPSLYQGSHNNQDIFEILGRHLEDKAMELGVTEYPQPTFKQEYRRNITSKDGVVQLATDVINQQVGAELAGLNAIFTLTDKAIAANHSSKTTPIVLTVGSDQLALDLLAALPRLTKNVYLVVAGKASKALKSVPGALLIKEVTEESVGHTLATIKKSGK